MKAMVRGKRFVRAALVAALLALSPAADAHAVRCGDVVGPNETVVLDRDLDDCAGPGSALTVIGPATLDLGSHVVGCADAAQPVDGIAVVGRRAVVRGGRIAGSCEVAVRLAGEGRHRVEEARVMAAGGVGLLLESDANVIVDTNVYDAASRGVLIRGSRNRIEGGLVDSSSTGYEIADGVGNKLVKTASLVNDDYGYLVSGGRNAMLRGNVALVNGRDGFRVSRGLRHNLKDNHSDANDGGGFVVGVLSERIRLQGNGAELNGLSGVQVWTPGHTLMRNTALNNDARQEGSFDLEDRTGGCSTNRWRANVFVRANVGCIR